MDCKPYFKVYFPLSDFNGLCSLEFVRYSFGEPKYTVAECIERGMTYEAPLKITVRLITFDVDEETGVQSVRDIKEQEVFLGALPLMTQDGVFVVNGTERVIVNQLQTISQVFFTPMTMANLMPPEKDFTQHVLSRPWFVA